MKSKKFRNTSSTPQVGTTDKLARDSGLRRHRLAPTTVDLGSHQVMTVTKAAHRFLRPGVVVRAYFPYVEGEGRSKARPAVVLSRRGTQVTLIPLTSSARATGVTDIPVHDLRSAGLSRPTTARTARVAVLDRNAVIGVLGSLSGGDWIRIAILGRAA